MPTVEQDISPTAPSLPASAPSADHDQCVVIHGVSWQAYVGIGELLRDLPVRMNYSRGVLEIMVISREHERLKSYIGRLVEMLTAELAIPMEPGGSLTMRREDQASGLEPDECYWIANEPRMRHGREFDPATDPPPDLAIEVEVSRTSVSRQSIYAALGVPEIWRWDGTTIQILVRGADGQYHGAAQSLALPFFPVTELVRFLNLRGTIDNTSLVRQFRAWVREQVAVGAFPKPRD